MDKLLEHWMYVAYNPNEKRLIEGVVTPDAIKAAIPDIPYLEPPHTANLTPAGSAPPVPSQVPGAQPPTVPHPPPGAQLPTAPLAPPAPTVQPPTAPFPMPGVQPPTAPMEPATPQNHGWLQFLPTTPDRYANDNAALPLRRVAGWG